LFSIAVPLLLAWEAWLYCLSCSLFATYDLVGLAVIRFID